MNMITNPRERGEWPSAQLVDEISELQMLFALVGHIDCNESGLQARQSWSHAEFQLISSLPKRIVRGYIAFQYIMKTLLAFRQGEIGIEEIA